MYYFAYIDADNVCTSVYAMPSDLSGVAGYVAITEEQYTSQSVVGMRWNASTSTWEEVVDYFYAVLDENDICINVVELDAESDDPFYIRIDTLDQSLIGQWYNRETETFTADIPFSVTAAHSTDEINVGSSDVSLTTKLNQLTTAIGNAGSGSGEAGADGEDGGYYTPAVSAEGVLSWTASKTDMPAVASVNIKGADGQEGAPGINGVTFTPSVAADGTLSWTNDGGLTNPTPVNIKGDKGDAGDAATIDAYTKTQVDTMLSGKADSTHTHDYAPSTHDHTMSDISGLTAALGGKADSTHTHSEYASSSHTHSEYASSSHTHSNYFSTSGGTISGETNFSGGLVRLKGVQTLYNSGSMITFSSNNVQTMIAGSAIFSKVTISVSSDERLKENIADVDAQVCIDFINALDVKTFNYKGNETPCVGVIAQQLEKVSPELAKRLVTKDADGMLGVKTSDLVFPLIVAVQSLSARVAELEK